MTHNPLNDKAPRIWRGLAPYSDIHCRLVRFFAPRLKVVWALLVALLVTSCDTWDLPLKEKFAFYRAVVPVGSWAGLKDLAEYPDGPAIIGVARDIVLTNGDSTINVTRPLTIISFEETRVIKRTATFTSSLFEVSGGGNLTLGGYAGKTLILDGGAIWNTDSPPDNVGVTVSFPLVHVDSARLTIRDGAILRNNHNDNSGGGINILASDGNAELTMTGGVISGNTADGSGGGVCVSGSGGNATLTMSGGVISGNAATGNGGGVYVTGDGTFSKTSSGGVIYGGTEPDHLKNTASSDGKGHAVYVNGSPAKYRDTTVQGGQSLSTADLGSGWNQ